MFGANIFQRPHTFFIRRKGLAQTFFKGRTHFSSGAKVWREHFSKAAHVFFRREGLAQTFSKSAYFSFRSK
jgi:hypothetical protein